MNIQYLQHNNGGKIVTITAIGHSTYKRIASVEFIGRVEWFDGSVSENAHIAPYALCRDSANPDACAELEKVLAFYTVYTADNGVFDADFNWIPHAKTGSMVIA